MSGDIDQGLRGEIRSILKTAGRMLTTAELYERSKLAESPTQVSAACSQMYVRRDLTRTANDSGRFMYCLRGDESALAAPVPCEPEPSAPVPATTKPAEPAKASKAPSRLSEMARQIMQALQISGKPMQLSQISAAVGFPELKGQHRSARLSVQLISLGAYGHVVREGKRGYYTWRIAPGAVVPEVAPGATAPTPEQTPEPTTAESPVTETVTPRPARFKTDLMGHLQAFTEDHAELMADAIASRAPYSALDALQQARNALDAAQRCLMSQGSAA